MHKGYPKSVSWAKSTEFLILTPISLSRILTLSSHVFLDLPRDLFPVVLYVKILKALIASFILTTFPTPLNPLGLISLTILGERYKL